MGYESRAYDTEHGDPVVVLVASGTHDVSRLVHLLTGGSPNCEQLGLGARVLRQLRRHNAGRVALRLLHAHGGPDFTADPAENVVGRLVAAAEGLAGIGWHGLGFDVRDIATQLTETPQSGPAVEVLARALDAPAAGSR